MQCVLFARCPICILCHFAFCHICILLYFHFVTFTLRLLCIQSYLHFVTFAICFIACLSCILLHLHFVSFAFCLICNLFYLHLVMFAFYFIYILFHLHFVSLFIFFLSFAFCHICIVGLAVCRFCILSVFIFYNINFVSILCDKCWQAMLHEIRLTGLRGHKPLHQATYTIILLESGSIYFQTYENKYVRFPQTSIYATVGEPYLWGDFMRRGTLGRKLPELSLKYFKISQACNSF